MITWKEVDSLLREGGRLHTTNIGAYLIDGNGVCHNISRPVLRAIERRDLVVVCGFDGNAHYILRSKYS